MVLRIAVLWVLVFTEIGIGLELLLTGHTEGIWQLIPLLLIGVSLGLLMGAIVLRRRSLVRAFQLSMLLCLLTGGLGLVLHYRAKMEFKSEMNPSLAGWDLFWQSIKGSAVPPVLAPAIMIQIGLLGLAYACGHPTLAGSNVSGSPTNPT